MLAHYDAVIWYVGDNIITQDLEDRDVFFPDSEIGVGEVIQFTTLAVRDYLNEGGKLIKIGDRAGYFGQFVGSNNWTTLNDDNGNTPDVFLSVCGDGLWNVHPFIFDHYVDVNTCTSPGPTGEFHSFNGSSNGWVDVSFDLSAYAGSQVEISLTYTSDVGVTNTGVFVDDVALEIDGVVQSQGWEFDQLPWSVAPPPPGSPGSLTDWARSTGLVTAVLSAAVATDKTVYLPFGFEAISTLQERSEVLGRLLDYLLQ